MLPVLDVSSPQPDDKHRGYADLLSSDPRCAVQWSDRACAMETPPRVVVARFIQHGTRHPVHGTDGSHSRV